MTQDSHSLLDTLNLFVFLMLLKQNSQLIPVNYRNPELHNTLQKVDNSFNKKKKLPQKNSTKEEKLENDNIKEKLKKHTFWDELYKHTRKVNYIKIKIMADGPESKITGYLANLHNDFITLVKDGEKINIPINKILTLKLEDPNKSNVKNKTQPGKNKKGNIFTENNENNIKKYHQLQLHFNNIMYLPKTAAKT